MKVWYEEYKHCACSFIAEKRAELPGYCPRHGNEKRRRLKLPDKGFERGYVGVG